MKKILAILVALATAVPLFAQTKSRYVVSMRRAPSVSGLRLVRDAGEAASHDVRVFRNFDFIGADLTDDEVAALRKSPDVNYIAPVVPRYIDGWAVPAPTTSGPGIRSGESHYQQMQTVWYGIDLVHARDVWPYTKGGTGGVNVVVVDTGIDYTHPDLQGRYQGGYNVFTKTEDPKDDHGHGTHVSGIIAADDNNFGVVGVAPEAKIWSVKVLQANGAGTDESVSAGLDWVISKKREVGGNWIMNLSLGATSPSDLEKSVFAEAISEGILVIAAAGNTGSEFVQYPAAYDQVIAVSAIDDKSVIAEFSSYGAGVAFGAPGVAILSTVPVGSVHVAEIDVDSANVDAMPLTGSATGVVTAPTIFCGLGKPEDFPAGTAGKIALINRGEVYFRDKVKNALAAGAIGVVIVPVEDDPARYFWTLIVEDPDTTFKFPVVLSTTAKDGANLIANAGKTITVSNEADDYTRMSGTSMATPHVSGVAALAWSLAPNASAQDMRLALKLSADDLGAKGYDYEYGYGRIDALSAAKYVAPGLFGLPPTPPPVPTRRRPSSPHH